MFLEILLSLGTISFFGAFALRPTALTITQLLKEINTKEDTIEKMDQKIQNIQTAESLFAQEDQRILTLNKAVPDNPSPETFVRQIEGLTKKHAVNILGITVGEVTLVGKEKVSKRANGELAALPEGAGELAFSMSITADYKSLSSFLYDLENLRRPAKIDQVSINSSETEKGKTLVLLVSGRVPYLKDQLK